MKEEWSCGHVSRPMCAECYRLLALRAKELAAENLELRAKVEELKAWRSLNG